MAVVLRCAFFMPLEVLIELPSEHVFAGGESAGDDKIMRVKRFTANKSELLTALRAKRDPWPRVMAGTAQTDTVDGSLSSKLEECLQSAGAGAKLVVGFKLFEVKLNKKIWGRSWAWKAVTWLVVSTPVDGGSEKYSDPNSATGQTFIFVPSSRIHPELTTDDYLSGECLLGTVVGGCRAFSVAVLVELSLMGRRLSVAAASPEGCTAKKRITVRPLPLFQKWHAHRQHAETLVALGELYGFPVAEKGHVIDDTDIDTLLQSVSPESLLDSFESLELELSSRSELLSGKLSIEDARKKFFAHFDHLHVMMHKARDKRREHAYELAGVVKRAPADVR